MSRRVAVTGIGCLSAAGSEITEHWRRLREGACLATRERLDLGPGESLDVPVARVVDLDRDAYLPASSRRRMSRLSQNWVIACLLARADAALPDGPEYERAGVCLGSAFGGLQCTADYLDGVGRDGLGLGNPFLFSESVANAPAGHAAIVLGCRGFHLTLTCGDLSGVAAVEIGARAIRDGRADIMYAGGADEITQALLAALARMGSVRGAEFQGAHRLRTPRAGRQELIPGEGAGCVVLEEWERARRRGARLYAEVEAGTLVSDPHAPPTRWSASARVRAEALRGALRRAGAPPQEVDVVVLHACGDSEADRSEEEAVERVVRAERPAAAPDLLVLRPARVLGQLAGAGAFSVIAAALALRPPEPAGADVRPEQASTGPARRRALASAASWGGGCAALLMRRAES